MIDGMVSVVAWRRGLGRWPAVVLPAGLLVVGVGALLALPPDDDTHRSPDLLGIGLLGLMTGALVLRRRWPLPVLAVTVAAMSAYQWLDFPPEPALPAVLVALYGVASTGNPRRSLGVGLATSAVVVATLAATEERVLVSDLLGAVSWVVVALALGEAVRYHRAYTAEVEARAARAEASREAEARQRVAQERLRIARDVHDVVAHSIAAINVQAGVAAHLIAQTPQPDATTLAAIREILDSIAETSRAGVADLHAILELLRGDESAETGPVSGLDGVGALVEPLRASGIEVEVRVKGAPAPLPPAHDVAAFRIIQEALTNAVKHGRAHRIDVTIRYDPTAVRVRVVDDGSGPSDKAGRGSATAGGYGIVGMRERAHSVGGELHAGRDPDGGFAVEAVLPLTQRPAGGAEATRSGRDALTGQDEHQSSPSQP